MDNLLNRILISALDFRVSVSRFAPLITITTFSPSKSAFQFEGSGKRCRSRRFNQIVGVSQHRPNSVPYLFLADQYDLIYFILEN